MQNELQAALFQAFDTLNLQRVKTFSVPPVTLCGPGAVSSCGQQAQTRGLKHLFVMADSFLHQAGMTAGLTRSLAVKGIAMTLWPCPVGEPCITDVCAAVAQTLSEQRLCRVLNIDIGGGTANYALFDAGKISGTACLNVGGRLLETDSQGRVVYAHKPGQMIVDECFGAGTDARSLTGAQLVQVTRRMAELIVEVIDGTLSPLAQALMQTGLLPAGVTPEIITLSGGVGECYRHQPADPFCFADIGPLLATALHDHPRLREMNVQFPAQTVRATVIGAGAHTLSLSGSTIWLEGVQLPLRNLPVAIPIDETDLVSAWQQALIQLDLDPNSDAYVLALPASLPVRYAAVLTVINALVDFVARFPNPHPLLVVAGQDFGKALGMLLRPQLQQLPLAVIDEVIVRAGDYIDIGTPLFGGSVVPVTVKSLAFPS